MEIIPEYSEDIVSVGSTKAQQMTIGNTAHLFALLSKNLYKNPHKAAVREIVTNAWDSHIASGCTDTPIRVDTTTESMIISDFGSGISPEVFMDLYGTVGGTNKQSDNNQTGGMGIGKMAPLACMSHFSVRSHYNGTATTYHIEGPTAEVSVPTINKIVETPTDRTGLDVIFPSYTFNMESHLTDIIRQGSIKCVWNDKDMDIYPDSDIVIDKRLNGFHFRYGSIIYPVPFKISRHLPVTIGDGIIIRIPGGSLNITPNREEIVFTDEVTKHITSLVKKVSKYVNHLEKQTIINKVELVGDKSEPYAEIKNTVPDLHGTPEHYFSNIYRTRYGKYSFHRLFTDYTIASPWFNKFTPYKGYRLNPLKFMGRFKKILLKAGMTTPRTLDNGFLTRQVNPLSNVYTVFGKFSELTAPEDLASHVILHKHKKIVIHTGAVIAKSLLDTKTTYIKITKKTNLEYLIQALKVLIKDVEVEVVKPERLPGQTTARRTRKHYLNVLSYEGDWYSRKEDADFRTIRDPLYVATSSDRRLLSSLLDSVGAEFMLTHDVALVNEQEYNTLHKRVTPPSSLQCFASSHVIRPWASSDHVSDILKTMSEQGFKYHNIYKDIFDEVFGVNTLLTDEDLILLHVHDEFIHIKCLPTGIPTNSCKYFKLGEFLDNCLIMRGLRQSTLLPNFIQFLKENFND